MNEIQENGIRIYTGEIDEEDDSSEIRDLRVSELYQVHLLPLPSPSCLLGVCSLLHCWQQHLVGGEREACAWASLSLGCGGGGE